MERGRGLRHFVTEPRQSELNQIADCVFIIDHENATGPRHCRRENARRFGVRFLLKMQSGRQVDREGGADMHFGLNRHQAVVIFDDRICSRESETVAFRLGGEVRIENPLHVFFWNTDAFVTNPNADVISRSKIGNGGVVDVVAKIIATDVKCAAIGHGLVGVDDEIRDDLTDLASIDFSGGNIVGEFEFTAVAAAAKRKADCILN